MPSKDVARLPKIVTLDYLNELASRLGFKVDESKIANLLALEYNRFSKNPDYISFLSSITSAFCKNSVVLTHPNLPPSESRIANLRFAIGFCIDTLKRDGFKLRANVQNLKKTNLDELFASNFSRAKIENWIHSYWKGQLAYKPYIPKETKKRKTFKITLTEIHSEIIKLLTNAFGSKEAKERREEISLMANSIIYDIKMRMGKNIFLSLKDFPVEIRNIIAKVVSKKLPKHNGKKRITIYVINN